MKLSGKNSLGLALLAALVAAGLFVAVVQGGSAPPQGLSRGVGALDRPTPATASTDSARREHDVSAFVDFYATRFHMSPATLLAGLRTLATGLGERSQTLYGFKLGNAYCFVVTGSGGSCAWTDGSSSFAYTIGGGDGSDQPGALAGIVADDVTSVTLSVDGVDIPVTIQNNAAYAQLPNSARHADVTVVHDDGKKTTDSINLSG
jgi:hypothetical protein